MDAAQPMPRETMHRKVEVLHLVVALVAVVVAAAIGSREVLIGLGAGFLLGGLNARALTALTRRMTSTDAQARGAASGLLFGKMLLLMGAVGAVLMLGKPDPVAFVVAISVAPAMMLGAALLGVGVRGEVEVKG
ncbi:MAG: hypothetical protein RIT45_3557 [Pseudomonadota bacterium]